MTKQLDDMFLQVFKFPLASVGTALVRQGFSWGVGFAEGLLGMQILIVILQVSNVFTTSLAPLARDAFAVT